jgi:uncharacterized protein (TIGR03085 family)
MTVNHARVERAELCDLFETLGPDVGTLCDGWNAADLAAHLVVRERRPDAALGILAGPFASHGENVRRSYADKPWGELIGLVRSGPPLLSVFAVPGVDRLANTMEFFIHHEDLRRPNGLGPRDLDSDLEDQLWTIVGRMSKMFLRKAPAGVTLVAADGRSTVPRDADPMVTVTGGVGELALFIYGRQDAAQVTLAGPDEAVSAVRGASFGI